MKNESDTFRSSAHLLEQLKALVIEADAIVAGLRSASPDSDNGDILGKRFDVAQQHFTEVFQEVKDQVVSGVKQTDTSIRENLYQSLAVALGAGLIVGVIVGRLTR